MIEAAPTSPGWQIGSAVQWVTHDRVTKRPVASVQTRICGFETVRRSDGTTTECAILDCHRLVPIAQLFPCDHQPDVQTRTTGRSTHKSAGGRELRAERVSAGPAARSTLGPAQQPQCRLLAVDFLNVLVRAYHAGAPTETHAVRSLFQTVANAIRTLRPRQVVFAMDGGHARRSQLLPAYKAHRPAPEPGLQRQKELAERALLVAGLPMIRVADWEADDVLASLATAHTDVVLCSSDKDLLALAGRCRIYHPWGAGQWVTPEDKLGLPAGQVTDYLALCGDASDGISGVRGVGPKTALQLLQEHENLEGILSAALTGRIKGALALKLNDQRSAALLCRQVVELNTTLPLPELTPWRPPAGYQQQLQAMGLGSAAAVLEAVADILRHSVQTSEILTTGVLSAATGQAEQGEANGVGGNPDRSPTAAEVDQLGQDDAQPSLAHTKCRPDPDGDSDRPVGEAGGTSPLGSSRRNATQDVTHGHESAPHQLAAKPQRIRRSIGQPLRNLKTVAERFGGVDRGYIFAWEQGRRVAGDPHAQSGWKTDTPLHACWLQGYRLQDLDMLVVLYDSPESGNTVSGTNPSSASVAPPPGGLTAARRKLVRSLF